MLGWRLAMSAILIPGFAGLFYFDHRAGERAPILLIVCVLIAIRCCWELVQLLQTRSFKPSLLQTALLAVLIIVAGWEGHRPNPGPLRDALGTLGYPFLWYGLAVLWLLASNAYRYREAGSSMETLGSELLIVSYVGVLLCLTAQLRWVAGAQAGYLVLGSLIVAAKCGDIGGYTLGRLFGKRKMSPLLSPGKTWAGAMGALLGAALGGWAWLHFLPPRFGELWSPCPTGWSILYGGTIGVVGLIGDLCESLIKRDLGKKDAAALMPGFGGLLDLVDSVIYSGPVAYLLWLMLPLATWPH